MILHPFSEFISNNTHTFRELLPNRSKHIFRVHIKQYWHFQGVTPKQYYTLFQTSKSTDLSRELRQTILYTFPELTSNKTDFFKRVTDKQYYTLFQSFYQVTGKQYCTHFIPSNNTNIFRELLANNTANISRFHIIIKQYWHFQRATTKQYWLIQSLFQVVFTVSQSYYQTIVNTFLRCLNGHLNRQKILKQKTPK